MDSNFVKPNQRLETGSLQDGDDWPGVFIRGDNALMVFAPILRTALDTHENLGALEKGYLEQLHKLLTSAHGEPSQLIKRTEQGGV